MIKLTNTTKTVKITYIITRPVVPRNRVRRTLAELEVINEVGTAIRRNAWATLYNL